MYTGHDDTLLYKLKKIYETISEDNLRYVRKGWSLIDTYTNVRMTPSNSDECEAILTDLIDFIYEYLKEGGMCE